MKPIRLIQPIALCIIALALVSCTGRTDSIDTTKLTGAEIMLPEEFTGAMLEQINSDTLLFVSYDPKELFETAVIQNNNLTPTGNLGHKGNGPREFNRGAAFSTTDGGIGLIATTPGGCTVVKVNDKYNTASWDISPIDSLVSNLYFTRRNIVAVDSSTILLVGASLDNCHNIMSVIDMGSKEFRPLDYWPEDDFTGNDFVKYRVYSENSSLGTGPSGKYAYAAGYNRNAFIFTVDGDHVNIIREIYKSPISYTQTSDGLNMKYNLNADGLKMYANKSGIYILLTDSDLNGKKADSSDNSGFGNIVEVYDWEGNLSKKYELDEFGGDITVYPDGSALILSSLYPDSMSPKFIRYQLD